MDAQEWVREYGGRLERADRRLTELKVQAEEAGSVGEVDRLAAKRDGVRLCLSMLRDYFDPQWVYAGPGRFTTGVGG